MFSKLFSKLDNALDKVVSDQYESAHPFTPALKALLHRDYDKAFRLMSKAVQLGDGGIEAQFQLGMMFANGQGCEQNFEKALEFSSKAATKGHTKAIIFLGDKFEPHDKQRAMKWYELAASQGDAIAQTKLGWLYFKESRDLVQAHKWLLLAAQSDLEMTKKALFSVQEKMSEEQIEQSYAEVEKLVQLAKSVAKSKTPT